MQQDQGLAISFFNESEFFLLFDLVLHQSLFKIL